MDVQEQHTRTQDAITQVREQLATLTARQNDLAGKDTAARSQQEAAMQAVTAAEHALVAAQARHTQAQARALIVKGAPDAAAADTAAADATAEASAAEAAHSQAKADADKIAAAVKKERDAIAAEAATLERQIRNLESLLHALEQEGKAAHAQLGQHRLAQAREDLQQLQETEAAARAAATEAHAKLEQFRASVADRFADWPELANRVREIARHEQHAALDIMRAYDAYLATLQEHVGAQEVIGMFHNGLHVPGLLVDPRLTKEAINSLLMARGISAGRDGMARIQSVRDDVAALRSAILERKPAQLKR